MKNKEMAEKISEKYGKGTVFPTNEECISYSAAMEMAEWKDQQFAEQKQQLIEKACDWLELNTQCGVHPQSSRRLINQFKKAMEE